MMPWTISTRLAVRSARGDAQWKLAPAGTPDLPMPPAEWYRRCALTVIARSGTKVKLPAPR